MVFKSALAIPIYFECVCVLSLHPLSSAARDSICDPERMFIIYSGAVENMSIALDDKQNTLDANIPDGEALSILFHYK